MTKSWDGRTILITGGATGGMGRAFAQLFLDAGGQVLLADRDEAALAEAVARLGEAGLGRVEGLSCDVTQAGDCRRAVDLCIARGFEHFGVLLCATHTHIDRDLLDLRRRNLAANRLSSARSHSTVKARTGASMPFSFSGPRSSSSK